jgi:hypothetical protein
MCAQLLKVFLGRASDPYAFPSVSANDLDSMYHEYTDFDAGGQLAEHFKSVLAAVASVYERVNTKLASKTKHRRLDVTVVMMYLQDASKNPQFKVNGTTIEELAKNLVDGIQATDDPAKPKGKSTSGSTLKTYYEWWRDNICKGAGVRVDPKRLFDDTDKQVIRTSSAGNCGVCGKPVPAEEEEFDHWPIPHRDGGPSVPTNGRLVHKECHPRGRPVDNP